MKDVNGIPPDRLGEASHALSELIAKFPDLAIAAVVHDAEARDGRGNTCRAFHLPDWSIAQYERRHYREGVVDEIGLRVEFDPAKRAQTAATMLMFTEVAQSCDKVAATCRQVIEHVEQESEKLAKGGA